MYEARKSLNISQRKCAEFAGVSVWLINALENLRYNIRSLPHQIEAIAAVLGLEADDICPPELAGHRIENTQTRVGIIEPSKLLELKSQRRYILPSPIETAEKKSEAELVHKLLDNKIAMLSDRQREILKLRYIDGFTLTQCAKVFRLTKERIRQHESKALLKLRKVIEAETIMGDINMFHDLFSS